MLALPGLPAEGPTDPSATPNAPSVFATLARRRTLFVGVVVGFVVLALLATLLSPKSYTTHVTFIAGGDSNQQGATTQTEFPVLNAIIDMANSQTSETYAEMMQQPAAAQHAIDQLGLKNVTPEQLLGHVNVKPVPNTTILDAAVTWNNPQTSAKIANTLADAYVALRQDLVTRQAAAATGEIQHELTTASARLQHSSTALAQYEAQNGIADLEQQTNAEIASLNALDAKIAADQVDQRQAQAQRGVVQSELARTPEMAPGGQQVAPNPVAAQLKGQLAQVEVQLNAARQQYTEEHPTVKSLEAQQAEVQRELASTPATVVASNSTVGNPVRQALLSQQASLSAEIAADGAQLSELGRQRSAAEPALRALPMHAAQLAELKRTAQTDQDVFDALQRKLGEAQIAQTTPLSDVAVISPANPAAAEVHPNVLINFGLSIVIGLLLGLAGVLLAERLDNTMKDEKEVSERLGLPILAGIPKLPSGGNDSRSWLKAVLIDSVLQLVMSLRYASSERLRSIAFTSAESKDGKSLVALEAAVAMGDLEPRVLLVDTDLRRPSLHEQLELDRTPGLSDVLVGTFSFEDSVRNTVHRGVDVVTAGTVVPNAFALLQSPAFDRFLTEAYKHYHTVILDTAPCAAVVDATAVCSKVDGTVFVVSANETDTRAAVRGLARLQSGGVRNVIGAVVNRIPPRRNVIGAYGEQKEGVLSFPVSPAHEGANIP